jgi:hypothetical protein
MHPLKGCSLNILISKFAVFLPKNASAIKNRANIYVKRRDLCKRVIKQRGLPVVAS